jgi:hypothetical protein
MTKGYPWGSLCAGSLSEVFQENVHLEKNSLRTITHPSGGGLWRDFWLARGCIFLSALEQPFFVLLGAATFLATAGS